jgi:hypothetical protein
MRGLDIVFTAGLESSDALRMAWYYNEDKIINNEEL